MVKQSLFIPRAWPDFISCLTSLIHPTRPFQSINFPLLIFVQLMSCFCVPVSKKIYIFSFPFRGECTESLRRRISELEAECKKLTLDIKEKEDLIRNLELKVQVSLIHKVRGQTRGQTQIKMPINSRFIA